MELPSANLVLINAFNSEPKCVEEAEAARYSIAPWNTDVMVKGAHNDLEQQGTLTCTSLKVPMTSASLVILRSTRFRETIPISIYSDVEQTEDGVIRTSCIQARVTRCRKVVKRGLGTFSARAFPSSKSEIMEDNSFRTATADS
jgi:hypothetical protein